MNKRIIYFNAVYYVVTLFLIMKGRLDPSSSLGYGYFIIIFWVISLIALVILLISKIIQVKSIPDYIGILTATPILTLICISIILAFNPLAQ